MSNAGRVRRALQQHPLQDVDPFGDGGGVAHAIGFLPPESHDQLALSQDQANRKKWDKLRERAWTQL